MSLFPIISRPKRLHNFANPLNGFEYHSEIFEDKKASKNKSQTINNVSVSKKKQKLVNDQKIGRLNATSITRQKIKRISSKKIQIDLQYKTLEIIKQKKTSLNSFLHKNIYPNVQILPLDLIRNYEDISKNILRTNLKIYFKFYFRKQIESDNQKLIEIIQKYMFKIKTSKYLDNIDKQNWPSQLFQVEKTEDLLRLIQKYKNDQSQYWTNHVIILLIHYCIPQKLVRLEIVQNIKLFILKQIQQNHNQQINSQNYVLLAEKGQIIKDALDISFFTQKLYITKKTNKQQNQTQSYHSYHNIIKIYKEEITKKNFANKIRNHMKESVKLQNNLINYTIDHDSKNKQRSHQMQHIMKILNRKNKKSAKKLQLSRFKSIQAKQKNDFESHWKQTKQQDNSSQYYFHITFHDKTFQKTILNQFKKYQKQSKENNPQIGQYSIYIYLLAKHHPIISLLYKNKFHFKKLKKIFTLLTNKKIPQDILISQETINLRQFIELSILTSSQIDKLINIDECSQVIRCFVQNYLNIKDDYYYHNDLIDQIYHILEGDNESLLLMSQVIWSWLSQNGFINHQIIDRQKLWTYEARSKHFYTLIASIIFGTFKTTPLDLAYELLV